MVSDCFPEGLCFFPYVPGGGRGGHLAIIGSLDGSKIISHHLQRIAIVYNPFAGGLKGHKRARLDAAVRVFQDAGRTVELFPTPGPNKAAQLARAINAGGRFDLILAAGGDGTINEAANGLAGSAIAFGALPAGTANVLAKEVGFSPRPDHAAKQLLEAVPRRVPMGEVAQAGMEPRLFLLMAGIGLDARIVYELDLNLKSALGKLAYWHGGFRQFGRPVPRFRVHVDGGEHHASFALLTRVRNYGGDFEIARRIRITDPDFEMIVFENHQWRDYLRFFLGVVRNRLDKTPGVTIHRATAATLDCAEDQRIYIQADGEAIGHLPASIRIVPDALTLLLPKRYALS